MAERDTLKAEILKEWEKLQVIVVFIRLFVL